MSVMPSEDDKDKWWKRSKFLRAFYHPLLMASDVDYARWVESKRQQNPSKRFVQQQIREEGLNIVSARDFCDVAQAALVSNPSRDGAIRKLRKSVADFQVRSENSQTT